ncbi:hypothetical protein ACNKHO_01190 [Shigella flexneri]
MEHAQNGLRLADQQRFVTQIDKRAAQLKIVVDRPGFFVFGEGEDRLIEQL